MRIALACGMSVRTFSGPRIGAQEAAIWPDRLPSLFFPDAASSHPTNPALQLPCSSGDEDGSSDDGGEDGIQYMDHSDDGEHAAFSARLRRSRFSLGRRPARSEQHGVGGAAEALPTVPSTPGQLLHRSLQLLLLLPCSAARASSLVCCATWCGPCRRGGARRPGSRQAGSPARAAAAAGASPAQEGRQRCWIDLTDLQPSIPQLVAAC